MYIEYTPIELFDDTEQHLQYPSTATALASAAVAAAATTNSSIGFEFGGYESVCGVGRRRGGAIANGFLGRKNHRISRRCSDYSTTTSVNSNSTQSYLEGGCGNTGLTTSSGGIPMGFDFVARIRKFLHFGDNSESGLNRKRRADNEWNSTSQFKYRKVENEFPKIITRSFEEDDLNIIPQRLQKVPPLVMAQRKQENQDERDTQFLRPKTVIKHLTNTAFADIEFSDDDEDEIILTNDRGESFNLIRQNILNRKTNSQSTVVSRSSKMANIPFKQKHPPPPLIEARTGGILASTLMPDLQPIRPPSTYSTILSSYANGLDNTFRTSQLNSSTMKERIVPITQRAPSNMFNGNASGTSSFRGTRSIIAQEYQTKDGEQYSELLQTLVPNLYGIKGTSPKSTAAPSKQVPPLTRVKSVPTATIDLTTNGPSNRKGLGGTITAIDLSDDDVSEIIDLVEDDVNLVSVCTKLQKEDRTECLYDVKRRAAERKNQMPYVEPVNTLKEKFDLSPVCKSDWLQNFQSKWEKRRLERKQELDETEKEVEVLTAETRHREKQMHERLKDLQIVDPDLIIVDDFPEGEEEPEFPVITSENELLIKSALFNGSPDQILITKFNMSITRRDISTLLGKNWLNDEVINFYMNLLTERGEMRHSEGLPKVYAMNTFFIPKIQTAGHAGVRRWTRKVDIFSYDIIPVPVHVGGVHWCMAIIHLRARSIKYYDSMGTPNPRILAALEQYLRDESLDKRKKPFDTSDFLIESVKDVPRQLNGSDCGVFSCMFAEYITRDRDITFSQQHMEYFRHKMILEIVQGKLMH